MPLNNTDRLKKIAKACGARLTYASGPRKGSSKDQAALRRAITLKGGKIPKNLQAKAKAKAQAKAAPKKKCSHRSRPKAYKCKERGKLQQPYRNKKTGYCHYCYAEKK